MAENSDMESVKPQLPSNEFMVKPPKKTFGGWVKGFFLKTRKDIPPEEFSGVQAKEKTKRAGTAAAVIAATAVAFSPVKPEQAANAVTSGALGEAAGDYKDRLASKVGQAVAGPDLANQASKDLAEKGRARESLNKDVLQNKGQPEYGKGR